MTARARTSTVLTVAVALALAGCRDGTPDQEPLRRAPRTQPPRSTDVAAGPTPFGLYVLALTWAPSFCCGHPDKQECVDLATAFAATHLTLHGLWPNYTDAEASEHRESYPEFCGSYDHCRRGHDASCAPDPATIPEEMRTLGPGFVGDHDFLADHEWPKHGSCTGLTPAAYFQAAIAAMKALPDEGTPDKLRAAIGGDLALADLEDALGVPASSVLLSCDADCRLSQISVCLAHDAAGLPTTPVACPANTTRAQYDNGCVTRGCSRVTVPQAGACERPSAPATHPHRREGTRACNHPGQGPACSGDETCVAAGFVRCARSGCCTSQP